MRVADLGSGRGSNAAQIWPGATVVRVDADPEVMPDVVADVRALPADLGKFDAILASHVLEHIPRMAALPAVRHWAEFLTFDGELHIVVPDLAWAAERILRGSNDIRVLGHIFGSGESDWQQHKFGYTTLLLRNLIHAAGLRVVRIETGPYAIEWQGETGGPAVMEGRIIYAMAVKPRRQDNAEDGNT